MPLIQYTLRLNKARPNGILHNSSEALHAEFLFDRGAMELYRFGFDAQLTRSRVW